MRLPVGVSVACLLVGTVVVAEALVPGHLLLAPLCAPASGTTPAFCGTYTVVLGGMGVVTALAGLALLTVLRLAESDPE